MSNDAVPVTLTVNGDEIQTLCLPSETLLETLRERLYLTGTKHGCELGECGACTVLVDGEPVLSCLLLTLQTPGHAIETIEGVARSGNPHPLQIALAKSGAAQCGYCIPAIVLTAKSLLEQNPSPSEADFREAIAGNICRCTGYVQILEALEEASQMLVSQR